MKTCVPDEVKSKEIYEEEYNKTGISDIEKMYNLKEIIVSNIKNRKETEDKA